MSVTFSSQAPMTAAPAAKFGNQQQARVSQFSGHNPANATGPQAGPAPKFGWICTTLCCAGAMPIAIIGGVLTALIFGIKKLFSLGK